MKELESSDVLRDAARKRKLLLSWAYVVPIAGTLLLLSALAGRLLFWNGDDGVSSTQRRVVPTWAGLAAAVVGQSVAVFMLRFGDVFWQSRLRTDVRGLGPVCDAACYGTVVALLLCLEIAFFLAFDVLLYGLCVFVAGSADWRSVFAWIVLCSWIDGILAGVYLCLFSRQTDRTGNDDLAT